MTIPKLVASDLDGTFMDAQGEYNHAYFDQVLTELNAKGTHFVVSTGRALVNVERVFAPFLGRIDIVSNNGGIIKLADGTILDIHPVSKDAMKAALALIDNHGFKLHRAVSFAGLKHQYMLNRHEDINPEQLEFMSENFSLRLVETIDEIKEPIAKMTFGFSEADGEAYIELARREIGDLGHVTTSGYGSVDVVALDVNKAAGLKRLADAYAFERGDLAAFGDGLNDIEMLHYAKHPYAMPNGDQELLNLFPQALADNNHAGVLKTIESILKN